MRKVQEDFRWAPFEKLEGICFEEKDFRETLDGGQAFTWRELDASPLGFAAAYEGVFRKTALRAAVDGRGTSTSARRPTLRRARLKNFSNT